MPRLLDVPAPRGTAAPAISRRELFSLAATIAAGSFARRAFGSAPPPLQDRGRPIGIYTGPGQTPVLTELTIPDGRLRGVLLPGGLRQFLGVPFAQAPIGPLRFRPPERLIPWGGVHDALAPGPAARQPHEDGLHQNEDCLYLNVWTPASPGPHPVFVWIHGGGYTGGSSFAPIFNGAGFAREGIVLVTVAYRLGAFGFLDLGSLLGSGYNGSANNGTRDVLEALRWVNRNIRAFGGDPARVTVGGESAGAKLTATLMALPEAQPLFQSAISESGGGERVLTATQAAGVAHRFAEQWQRLTPAQTRRHGKTPLASAPGGSPTDDNTPLSAFFAALLTADPRDLLVAQERTIAASPLHFPFRPEVDGTFLHDRPVDLVAGGSSRGKRLLIGTNRDESALFLGPHPETDPTARDLGNLAVERFAPVLARYAAIYPDMPAALCRIRATSAEEYWIPSVRLADAHARNGGPTWMYRLDFAPGNGRYAGESVHASDLDFVWNRYGPVRPARATNPVVNISGSDANRPVNLVADPALIETADSPAITLAAQMHTAWCAFIRGEAPAAPGLPLWPVYNADRRPTLLLDRTSRVEDRPAEAELRLWDGVL